MVDPAFMAILFMNTYITLYTGIYEIYNRFLYLHVPYKSLYQMYIWSSNWVIQIYTCTLHIPI